MKNEKNEDGQILFHVGRPELKDKNEYAFNQAAQNRLKGPEKDIQQVGKKGIEKTNNT